MKPKPLYSYSTETCFVRVIWCTYLVQSDHFVRVVQGLLDQCQFQSDCSIRVSVSILLSDCSTSVFQ